MRKLTEIGFLKRYLKELSDSGTSSIYKLLKETEYNHRLLFPVAYYCYIANFSKETYANYPKITAIVSELEEGKNEWDKKHLLDLYNNRANYKEIDDNIKSMYRDRICDIMSDKQISTYRIYSDLNLDVRNTTYFLRDGDCGRLKLDDVREILKYARDY